MKKTGIIIAILILIILLIRFLPLKFHYTVAAAGKILTRQEWLLSRTADGRVISTLKNNEQDQISDYGGREFLRGDLFNFTIDPMLSQKNYINKNDVIARLYSNEIAYQITKLEADMAVEEANYNVYATGEKPAIIEEAEKNKKLAEEKLSIERKLFERKQKLYRDSLISRQEFELAQNSLEVCRIGVELTQTQLMKLTTGDKQQQLDYAQSRIAALQTQIDLLKKRMNQFEIRAPFSGMLQRKKGIVSTTEIIADILDTSSYIVVTPVPFKDVQYIPENAKATFKLFHMAGEMPGNITRMDNVVQVVGGKQAIYVTAKINYKNRGILPGMFTYTEIDCGEITIWEYTTRILASVINR